MKTIKTYEVFKNWFKKKSIEDYENNIEYFLDDIKDISFCYYKKTNYSNNSILYCFCFKDYESKKEEISMFLEEIQSACDSININFYNGKKFYFSDDRPAYILKTNINELVDYIILDFYLNNSSNCNNIIDDCANTFKLKIYYNA